MTNAETQPDSFRVFEAGAVERLQPYLRRLTAPARLRASTKQEWIQQRSEIRARLLAALGLTPLPDRLSADAEEGAAQTHAGCRLRRVTWRTWPEARAAGWLASPAETAAPGPAVLLFPGRVEEGLTCRILVALASLGITALALEQVSASDAATGLTPVTVDVLAGIRALDLLAGQEEVDRERLGVWGAPGAAGVAALLMAVDERPRALVLDANALTGADAGQCGETLPELPLGLSWPAVLAVPSPRALLLQTENAATAGECGGVLLSVYRTWQQPDRLRLAEIPGSADPGQAAREAAYGWLARSLRAETQGASEEPDVDLEGGLPLPEGTAYSASATAAAVEGWYRKRVPVQPPQLESRQSRRNYQERVREELLGVLGIGEPVELDADPRREPTGEAPEDPATTRAIRRVSFNSEWGVRVPAIWVPGAGAAPWRALIAVHPEGKAAALRSPLVRGLQREGFAVLAPDVRFRGEQQFPGKQLSTLGRPEAGMALTDLLACVDWLHGHPDVDPRSIAILGEGDQGVAALLAAGMDERIWLTVADCARTTYRDGGVGLPVIPNILRVADVPQLASLVAPRRLWLYHVPEERVGFSSRRYYDWTRRSYQSLGDQDALSLSTDSLPSAGTLWEWLNTRPRRGKR